MNKLLTAAALLLAVPAPGADRAPAVAGQFYPASVQALSALVGQYLAAADTSPEPSGEIAALLVPHAGLVYSGPTAAKAYRRLERGRWDTVVIVGSGHYKVLNGAAVYPGRYGTPEGYADYDEPLARALVQASPLVVFDAEAHRKEHSIEVQLPFLRRRLGAFKLVALVMNTQDLEAARAVGRALAKALKGRRALLIASSDQSHYPARAAAEAVDASTLEALSAMDPASFWLTNRFLLRRGVPDLAVSYCGEGAVLAVLEAARLLGAGSLEVLGRANSADEGGDADHVVGYAAAAFLKGGGPKPRALSGEDQKELLKIARDSIKEYLSSGTLARPPLSRLPRLNLPAAAFVTLWKKGELRGCVGHTSPQETLVESVARNAVGSAVEDKRFKPLTAAELEQVKIEVEVLSAARPVTGAKEVKPGDGVILQQGAAAGVFLPQVWEKLPDKEAFLAELCSQKAGLPRDCYTDSATRFKVFAAVSFQEP